MYVLVIFFRMCTNINFFFNATPTTDIYTLSLHDALPISSADHLGPHRCYARASACDRSACGDRKSTRLNSSHRCISYAVFCLKKKISMWIFFVSRVSRSVWKIGSAFGLLMYLRTKFVAPD